MAYVAVSDIQNEFKLIVFGSANAIGSSQVLEWINQEEARVNGEISSVYSVPVSSSATIGFAIMRGISTLAVKARILNILEVKTGKSDTDQGSAGDALYEKVWGDNGMIQKIKNRDLILIDAVLIGTGGVSDYNSVNDVVQTFEKDVDQW